MSTDELHERIFTHPTATTDRVNPRPYHAPRRQEQARRTRRAILDAAGHLFVERGYAATTMTAIAQAAGVALDTVYAAVGPKPVLFRLLVETAISGTEAPVPALERDYVRAVRAEPGPARKLTLYAQAVGRIQQQVQLAGEMTTHRSHDDPGGRGPGERAGGPFDGGHATRRTLMSSSFSTARFNQR